ncbi:MAG TPA: hypothetical protein VGF95_07150 [Solirubrobacteraceae bacterium]|jgi:hypothetical protein
MPEFCRHNRFVERCPICSRDLPDLPGVSKPGPGARRSASGAKAPGQRSGARRGSTARGRRDGLRVYADGSQRQQDDGYSCELVPGLRASQDARRLADELAFASARLWELATSPPGPYREAHELGQQRELERASWLCFLIAYLSPAEGEAPFAGIAQAFAQADEIGGASGLDLDSLPLGPRTSHLQGAGSATFDAYGAWVQRNGGSQQSAFSGDPSWSPQRRFERVFERLALPGLSRAARFELLVLLGRLELYQVSADSLHLAAGVTPAPGGAALVLLSEPVLAAAKRVFGIGDALNIERRAATLVQACGTPIEALELALFNWGAAERATLGMAADLNDEQVQSEALAALGL